jgi:F-type H+-transporting ATPase subunit b
MQRFLLSLIAGFAVLAFQPLARAAEEGAHGEAAHGAASQHGGAHHGLGAAGTNTSPADFKSDLAIFTVIIFLLLMAILWKFAWGPISSGLEKREHRIAEHIAAAERNHEEAKQLLAQYELRLAQAQDEVKAILDEARRDAEHTQQEILARARAEAAAESARAKHDVETARDQALKQLVETSANLATELAGRILKTRLSVDDHAKLIDEAVAKFHPQHASRN